MPEIRYDKLYEQLKRMILDGTFRNKLAAEVKDNIPPEKSELPPFHWIMKHRRWKIEFQGLSLEDM